MTLERPLNIEKTKRKSLKNVYEYITNSKETVVGNKMEHYWEWLALKHQQF